MPFLPSLDRHGKSVLEEEIPVTTTPIFEGHLSVRTDKKHWQWRLFRFDGSKFTCLSTRKVKLPPNTTNQNQEITTSTSSYSLTSPLLATPKDKNKRLLADGNKTELKYYQLPEWTIDVENVSSISVLKKAKKSSSSPSKCFSIRTFLGQCFILKAQKQKDLERWLFVLTKMWKFTQAVKNQVMQQQQQFYSQQQQQAQAQAILAVQQQQQAVEDNIPLVHSIGQQQQQQQQQQTINSTAYDTKYRSPILSEEKIRVIDEWRRSLAELMASDPCIRISSPPPIEPIPDDDTMSVFTDMTSVSNRPKSLKRRGGNTAGSLKRSNTAHSSRSIRRNKTNSISPTTASTNKNHQEMSLDGRTAPTLRKKRSDDVRNWMNNTTSSSRPSLNINRTASMSSHRKPMIQKLNNNNNSNNNSLLISTNYYHHNRHGSIVSTSPEIKHDNLNFFQDVFTTILDDDSCLHAEGIHAENTLRYHTSIRGKKLVQINQGDVPVEERRHLNATLPQHKEEMNNRVIARRASMPLTDNNVLIDQQRYQHYHQPLFDQQQFNTLQSPLQFLSMTSNKEEEEDMCLADLQKSLRQVGLHNRSPSATSIHDLQKKQQHYYQPHAIVAPAIPPHQYQQQQRYSQHYLFDTSFTDQHKKNGSSSSAAIASKSTNLSLVNPDIHTIPHHLLGN